MSQMSAPSPRATVRRLAKRADYARETIHAILDEGLVCHVGFAVDGQPFVIPTAYGRVGETLYLHGAPASRMLRALAGGVEVCVTVTLLDGLVLARSAFHHSLNYRSVVVFGRAEVVTDVEAKRAALGAFTEHVVPGRAAGVRPPSDAELAGTLVLALPLDEASAKVRSGPPVDDPEDLVAWPVWAGEVPLTQVAGAPLADPHTPEGCEVPEHARAYRRPTAP